MHDLHSYVVTATGTINDKESATLYGFTRGENPETDYAGDPDWSSYAGPFCIAGYDTALALVRDAQKRGFTDVQIRHVELGEPLQPDETRNLERKELFARLEVNQDELPLLVGLTEEDLAALPHRRSFNS